MTRKSKATISGNSSATVPDGAITIDTVPSAAATAENIGQPQSAGVAIRSHRAFSTVRGSTLSFHSLNYSVRAPAPGKRCCCCMADKQILHDISGIFRPGMNAIMGPTGSGKTTLLDVLAGRTEHRGIEGYILVDGHQPPKNFKCMNGYVVQDDVVMGTLTVRENLMFSANLRLPQRISHREKCALVNETIEELGLTTCANSKVGTEFIRGVSGGERKRTNIGMELIISPPVLFLDEPTTGLDASTANAVTALLHRLSLKGRTIIFSIHQPRFAIYKLFDRLSLLGAGRTIYHGVSSEALTFFNSIGYECEEHNNPPDFFLDVINGDSTAVRRNEDHIHEEELLTKGSKQTVNGIITNDGSHSSMMSIELQSEHGASRSLAEQLSAKYYDSVWSQRCGEELKPILAEYLQQTESGTKIDISSIHYTTSFLVQLKYVAKRTLLNLTRNPQTSILQTAVSIFMAVVIGIIFLRLDLTSAGLQSRQGLLFFVCVNSMMSNIPAIELFIRERVIFVHESASGFYRTSAYFLSKVLCDLVPMRIIPLIAFSIIVYFMTGLQMEPGKFFLFFLTVFLTTICASAVAFTVSATVGVFAIANLFCVLIFILNLIFGGLLVNIRNLGDWIRWLQYLSIIRYSLNTLTINELKSLEFSGRLGCASCNGTVLGSDFLDAQGIKHETGWDLWQNIMALGLMAIGIMCLAYIQLRRMKKLK